MRIDGDGGYVLSRPMIWLFSLVLPALSAAVGTGYVGDLLRDRDVAEVRPDLARVAAENADQICELIGRWQYKHDVIAAVKAEVGELDHSGASITARHDQRLEAVYRRLDMLETAIGGIRTELAAINVRLDILLGRDGQGLREGMQAPARSPATRAG